jgi:Domain of unknown function (DUF1929)
MLIADGRLVSLGGGAPGPTLERNIESFLPPWLFKADGSLQNQRPNIEIGLNNLKHGQYLEMNVSGNVTSASLLKLGSTTHSYNAEQRHITLKIYPQPNGQIIIQAPAAHVAPPGYYFLTVVDAQGVPSLSKIIRVGG